MTQRKHSAPLHLLQGLLMGGADVIPGVSGGTVALIIGIYERLVAAIGAIASAVIALLRRDWRSARGHWRRADIRLLIPLLAGITVAIGIGSVLLPLLIERYPVATSALFFGLIAGALPIPWRRVRQPRPALVGLALAGALAAFGVTGLTPRELPDPALLVVFAAAAVAICAMILPGVSGAFLLLIMGIYEPTLHALRGLDAAYVIVFVLGAGTGLALFSKLLSWLLDQRHDPTMAVLVGLMAGSLRRLWPWQAESGALQVPTSGTEVVVAIGLALLGFTAVTTLVLVGERTDRAAVYEH